MNWIIDEAELVIGCESGLKETGRDTIVAVELHVVERGGDAIPSGHGSRLVTLNMGPGGQNNTAVAHRLADQHNVDLDRSSNGERPGAQEVNAGGTDIARNKRDGEFLWSVVDTAESQGKLQGGAGIFAMLGMNADGVSGDASEAARLDFRRACSPL